MNKQAVVSVLLSVYNSADTLEKSLKSVVEQSYEHLEIICIDDASTDSSYEVLKKFKQKYANASRKFILLRNKENQGLTPSLNSALSNAIGQYIARIDADDWWEKEKIAKQVAFLETHSEYVLVGTWFLRHNVQNGDVTEVRKPVDDSAIRQALLQGTPFLHSSIVWRRELGISYNEKYDTTQDYDLYSRLLLHGKAQNIDKFLAHKATNAASNISTQRWKRLYWNRLRIRKNVFRLYPHSLWDYRYFLIDFCFLLLPDWAKDFKNWLFR